MRFLFFLTVALFSFPIFAETNDCVDARIASSGMSVIGQEEIEIDCRLTTGKVEFPVIYQFMNQDGPIDHKISIVPMSFGSPGFEITMPQDKRCSDAAGILSLDVAIDCDTASGQYLLWFHSGSLTSQKTKIIVIPQ